MFKKSVLSLFVFCSAFILSSVSASSIEDEVSDSSFTSIQENNLVDFSQWEAVLMDTGAIAHFPPTSLLTLMETIYGYAYKATDEDGMTFIVDVALVKNMEEVDLKDFVDTLEAVLGHTETVQSCMRFHPNGDRNLHTIAWRQDNVVNSVTFVKEGNMLYKLITVSKNPLYTKYFDPETLEIDSEEFVSLQKERLKAKHFIDSFKLSAMDN